MRYIKASLIFALGVAVAAELFLVLVFSTGPEGKGLSFYEASWLVQPSVVLFSLMGGVVFGLGLRVRRLSCIGRWAFAAGFAVCSLNEVARHFVDPMFYWSDIYQLLCLGLFLLVVFSLVQIVAVFSPSNTALQPTRSARG